MAWRHARPAQKFRGLVDGRLHLTAASLLAKEMDASNAEALIAASAHQTRRAIEALLADRAPKPDAPTRTQRVPSPRPAAPPERSLFDAQRPQRPYPSQAGRPRAATTATTPLGQARFKVSFTASARLMGKLEQLGALLSHTTSPRDLPGQLEAAVDVALDVLHKRRFGAKTQAKRTSKPVAAGSRHIPLAVRGAVHERDGGRCSFVAPDGRRCDSTHRLQLDHIVPFALGGPSTADNLRLRCQTHNLLEARRTFGPRRQQGALDLTG